MQTIIEKGKARNLPYVVKKNTIRQQTFFLYRAQAGSLVVRQQRYFMPQFFSIGLSLFFLVFAMTASCQATEADSQPQAKEPATLIIQNKSHFELVALRITSADSTGFARLDLNPGDEDELENPGGTAVVSLDLGLVLGTWKDIPLDNAQKLTLSGDKGEYLLVQDAAGNEKGYTGELKSLLPEKDAKPSCSLDGFHTGMTMKQVCGLLESKNEMEDEILLASMGFANTVWSARLFASKDKNGSTDDAVLEGVELRQKLTGDTLRAVMADISQRHKYVPWQASLPGIELTFSDMAGYEQKDKDAVLSCALDAYLAHCHGNISVQYVSADVMQKLVNSEVPDKDIQIYTISTHGASQTLIVEMTAYTFEDIKQ